MKGKRYSEEQIVHMLKDVEGSQKHRGGRAGVRRLGDWPSIERRGKYCGMDLSELRRLRELEAENARLKNIVARQNAISLAVSRKLSSIRSQGGADRRSPRCHWC
jgi:putative transposase